ncbi:hypothetical protein [Actinoplanes couchii]|uniref:T3SS peptide-binding chaperone domain-containing protein n=1 Tax=Actinoplanes couchii TaxID=403638 RepID=A0ABQ3X8M8_9ACTN|nr:hypothetical protein [Actinoplanes couchii]MDR6320120.1 hypothetical protein [Actinoplanes couchii]GID54865.1 hypothetical protein Aco03nite_032690 [Actinoplanes couchii]
MPAERFILAQSWWLASQLFRRHPKLTLIETHPGGGLYDCLTLVSGQSSLIHINRVGGIDVSVASDEPFKMAIEELFDLPDPVEIIPRIETAARIDSPAQAPPSTPAALTYRAIAHLMAITVNDKRRWDVRNERIDSSGMGGGGTLGSLAKFPVAAARAKEKRPGDLLGDPLYRYWGVLRDGKAIAVLDTDGYAYVGHQVHHLPTLYQAGNRRVTAMTAAAFAEILP